jgi:Cof subfamily protein (haloacid dehalogenase superfamily)
MGNIRLIVVDLDGTVVGATNQIQPAVKQVIRAAQAQGVPVAIATGRMYRSALRFHQAIESTLPLMSYQGAYIRNPATEQVHQHLTVSRQGAEALLDYFEQPELRDRLSVHFYINDQLYVREISEDTENYAKRSTIQPIAVGDLRQTLETEPTKILALCEDPDLIDEVLTSLQARYSRDQFYFTKSVATFFEAAHAEVNKGAAVKYLAEQMLGLNREQVMTLGDNFNDVEMLEYAGIGVAMGDAPEAVKAIADWVAPSVEDNGAVVAIEKFVLS